MSSLDVIFRSSLSLGAAPSLGHHRVDGAAVLPATACLEMALSGATQAWGDPGVLRTIVFREMLTIPEKDAVALELVLHQDTTPRTFELFRVEAAAPAGRTLHATGQYQVEPTPEPPGSGAPWLAGAQSRCRVAVSGGVFYARANTSGIHYGPSYQGVEQLWKGNAEALGRARLPQAAATETAGYLAHPALLDACLQVAAFGLQRSVGGQGTWVPVGVDRFWFHGSAGPVLWSHARRTDGTTERDTFSADVRVGDEAGRTVGEFTGLHFKRLADKPRSSAAAPAAGTPQTRPPTVAGGDGIYEQLRCASPEQRQELLVAFIKDQVRTILRVQPSRPFDPARGFFDVGMDSLMAVDLQFRLQQHLHFTLPSAVGFTQPTIEGLARYLLTRVLSFEEGPAR